MTTDKIKVAVRVRPFNRREIELGTRCVTEMKKTQTILHHPVGGTGSKKQPKVFAFDHSFQSMEESQPDFADQEQVYKAVGQDLLDNSFQGYNACIFAYGQTGSGKSYTMMGSQNSKGLIPRLCDELFERIAANEDASYNFKVEVSYMEIYNEKVHDLLDPKGGKQYLKVREHNVLGPYVDGLSVLAVTSFEDIDNLMLEGNKSRTVAATNMNSESSRSHAVFSVILSQTVTDLLSGVQGEKVSRMSLVDLAGSERAIKTGAVGDRLKEGSNINKSLTTLGLVISKLADQSSGSSKDKFVPYRDSVLTWLLKDNLGGNSKTVMVATISPAADNYEETLSTLRYADRAKRIVNHAVVNEDPNAKIIRELRAEVEQLKEQLKCATQHMTREDISEKLSESEKLMEAMSETWEQKLQKTERVQQERQQALEKMGISVQASGIGVEKNKYYLVNLNADPTLNELLVYYLKERTCVGSATDQDIQLSGLGIQSEHSVLAIEDGTLWLEPIKGARTCVNGSILSQRVCLLHGDRVLWGNNHFFRVNCPKTSENKTETDAQTPAQPIDYNFAQEELMMKELSNDPIQAVIKRLERQHEEEKQVLLEKQRQEYERQFAQLRNMMSPSTPYPASGNSGMTRLSVHTPTSTAKAIKWEQERESMFKHSLADLRADILKANRLVREANVLSEEMNRETEFKVTLQIPAQKLSPNRKAGSFVSEPAILVKRKGYPSQIWSMDKLENKLFTMRDWYQEEKDNYDVRLETEQDPFFESQESHHLIGVANVFLEVLFHDTHLEYQVPVISQQGEVAGRLLVRIGRVAGRMPGDRESNAEGPTDSDEADHNDGGNVVTVMVQIKQATGLPPTLSHYVFCQYSWPGQESETVAAKQDNNRQCRPLPRLGVGGQEDTVRLRFDYEKKWNIPVTEEFLEFCQDGALAIEVWGNSSAGFGSSRSDWEVEQKLARRTRSFSDRWRELSRRIELWIEIQELNDVGEYSAVEVSPKPDILTGGMVQLRQGQQRRILLHVMPVQNSGTLPLICEAITSIAIGSICTRSKLQKPLDSYQEEDLGVLRDRWSDAVMRRRQYLDEQIQKIIQKKDKTVPDKDREQALVDQWVCLTEERNAVLVPCPDSPIPGAPPPPGFLPSPGMEEHVPVIFLDLNADDLSTTSPGEGIPMSGSNSILPKEHSEQMYQLPIIRHDDNDVCAIAQWDSSIHDSVHLNRVTPGNERVYLIVKVVVRLSHPAVMDLVLRKRLCINIYKRQSIADRIRRGIGFSRFSLLTKCGVTYDIVSNIPKASEELEDRESLAQMAALDHNESMADGETYIEKYIRGVSAVENLLSLDRLRQCVAVKELLQSKGQASTSLSRMRKTVSVPNISHILRGEGEGGPVRSESFMDLASNASLLDLSNQPSKPFGLASPNAGSLRAISRMTTLQEEEPSNTKSMQEEVGQCEESEPLPSSTKSPEQGNKTSTPSLASSGYGSRGLSCATLSSEDSISVRSISADETPETDPPEVEPPTTVQVTEEEPKMRRTNPKRANRASYPAAKPVKSDSKDALSLEQKFIADRLGDSDDISVPEWMVVGESILVRPYNTSGVIAYIGGTDFAGGLWVGVELDTPTGKNDGSVHGIRYFTCPPKFGMFVRAEKLILDKRGRAMRSNR